jgi:aspartate aminotransferase/aminotransferase
MISNRAKRVDSSGIRKVFELAAKIENPINFSIGQPDFDVPVEIQEAAIDSIRKGFNRYTLTQGIPELREKMTDVISASRGKKYTPNEVIITSGVSGGLLLALFAILDPGDEVVVFDPYFVMYKHLVNLLDAEPVIVDTYPDFSVDYDKLKAAVSPKTKAIVVNSPTNPTGYVYTKQDMETIVKVARENNILVISDEIYEAFLYEGELNSPVSIYDNVLLLGGFSKTYAMTGWRMGYAAGNSELIAQMIKLQQYTFVCAPSPFQYASLVALDYDIKPFQEAYRRKRDIVYNGLKDSFDIVKPQGSFYIFPALKHGDVSEFVEKAIEHKILIIPGNVFSERNTNFRIAFTTEDDKLREGAEKMAKLAEEFYASHTL